MRCNNCPFFENIDAVIFDFDGTLYDKKWFAWRLLTQNIKDVFLIRAERKTRNQMKGIDFLSAADFYENFIKMMSIALKNKKYTVPFLKNWYFEHYLTMLTHTLKKYYTARVGVENLFDSLTQSNIKIAVFSDYSAVAERMSAVGLNCQNKNIALFSAEEFGALKPAPRPFLEIAKQWQVNPKKTLVIGDRTDTDGIGAKNAGMKFLLLINKNNSNSNNETTWENLTSKCHISHI
ncbi:MAG: HAD family phosphatase [Bacteroidales bacterium]|jgi:FMN phosphatase YigB (HAD superfamily)|nr:HAD family phosphatase [Bacteroidales bacterium]